MEQQNQNLLTERLNETGFPFQEWCYEIIKNIDSGYVVKEYPYTIPSFNGNRPAISGAIDLLSFKYPKNDPFQDCFRVIFSIECKKSKSGIKNWCFIKTDRGGFLPNTYFVGHAIGEDEAYFEKSFPINHLNFFNSNTALTINDVMLQGYEVNHQIDSLNRNQEEKIYKSILQAVHGCRWLELKKTLIIKEISLRREKIVDFEKRKIHFLFIPLIVTTSDLYVAEFEASNVQAGEIKENKIKWEKKDYVVYDFGLPDYLQNEELELINRAVFIVNDKYFEEFYKKFSPIIP